ncbi:E3 ubiquitin-protein ligase DTX3L1 isoform X2 [Girardinichthys multiradiatus]|uniref:E3 ubiquitin-protein ligase DTX3L1 isoform X2 n=1 Tax=Girardinichthys multiradiatus TaxID=208333 RepID=UPI001FADC362|nr:E3 ubiquitin-protein ligase DTX3L1 isoform X2 [Girardinichthys multiradiatus]
MGSSQSSDKLHCNRYLKGQGPNSLVQQVNKKVDGRIIPSVGCQPKGKMTWEILHKNIPGFPDDQTLKITYVFPEGIQTEKHPNPGQPYTGSQMCTYLPDNHEGKTVLTLLEKAFNQQLLFTIAIGESGDDVVTTASVPLKIQLEEEGSMIDGYPDMNYLMTLNKVLRNKGIK